MTAATQPRQSPWPRRWAVPALIAALALTVAVMAGALVVADLRLPWSFDEHAYGYEGWVWMADGGLPYRDFVENKPPVIYLLWGLAQRWAPGEAWPMRLAALAALLATGWIVGWLARAMGYRRGAAVAGLLAAGIMLSPRLESQYGLTEPFMVLCTVGMVVVAFRARQVGSGRLLLLAGVLGGLAFLSKQVAACEVLAVAGWLLTDPAAAGRARLRAVLLLGAGFLVPVLASWLWAQAAGVGPNYLRAAFGQLVLWGAPTWDERRHLLLRTLLDEAFVRAFAPLYGAGLLYLLLRRGRTPGERLVLWWLPWALVGALVGSLYRHQFQQVAPAVALGTAVAAGGLWRWVGRLPRGWSQGLSAAAPVVCLALLVLLALPSVRLSRDASRPALQEEAAAEEALAQAVRAAARPGDRLLTWRGPLRVNVLAGLRSPTPYATDFYYRRPEVAEEVRATLAAQPPRFALVKRGTLPGLGTGPPLPGPPVPGAWLEKWLAGVLRADYRLLTEAGGYALYERGGEPSATAPAGRSSSNG